MNIGNKIIDFSKKTKIIATLGPSVNDSDKLIKLVENGVNIFRLNFSHGTHEEQGERIKMIRNIAKNQNIYIPILLDTKGPEIRVGLIENDKVLIEKNHQFRISMEEVLGNSDKISVTHKKLYDDVKIGDHIKIDDGILDLEVVNKDEEKKEIIVKANNEHVLQSKKGVNAPSAKLSMNFISEKDESDLKFGCENNVDFIAASFTRKASDIKDIKNIIKKYGKPNIPVIAKIENPEGISNIDEIIETADGIMVARGDLGVEVPAEMVPVYQKEIISKCHKAGKPVIVATQMLESMKKNPRPTRAEVNDVYNAVDLSADTIMLSAETASGLYPFESANMQRKISITAESLLNYKELSNKLCDIKNNSSDNATANAVNIAALTLNAKLIISFLENEKDKIAYLISKTRPICPIIAVSDKKNSILKSSIYWGVYGCLVDNLDCDCKSDIIDKIVKDLNIKSKEPIIIIKKNKDKENIIKIVYSK